MQTRCALLLCVIGVVAVAWPAQVCGQDDVPRDPELGFLPPEEDLPEPEQEQEKARPQPSQDAPPQELGLPPEPAGEGAGLAPREASAQGRHGQQTQVLSRHQLRIEAGPPDFALRDSGFLAEGRGLRLGRADLPSRPLDPQAPQAGLYAGLGIGLSVGVLDNFEVGILQLPVLLDNGYDGADYGNLEMHARYGALRGEWFELGVQLVLQVPTHNAFGTGLGMPVRILATDSLVIDTGLELEVLKFMRDLSAAGNAVNLDVPVAVNYYVVPEAFVGGRVGLFVLDFDDVYIPLGVQGGYALKDGMVELTGWFQWAAVPLGELRFSNEVLDAGSFEFGLGCNVLLDFGG